MWPADYLDEWTLVDGELRSAEQALEDELGAE
jgi:hypothetical protein